MIDLHRTFSELGNNLPESDTEDWERFTGTRSGRKTWNDLHEAPISVILGEAGIGKTVEFKLEVGRLRIRGLSSFFVALSELVDTDAWELALTEDFAAYQTWLSSDDVGYFFLDSVDESRLKSHVDFVRALKLVRKALAPHLDRVRFSLSSRVSDWANEAVRSAIHDQLTLPLVRALFPTGESQLPPDPNQVEATASESETDSSAKEILVVGLDPLELEEAKRCANAFGLLDSEVFWGAVDAGDYGYMATRPLDLTWMVGLWNERRGLGTYLELIAHNVENRLKEANDTYQTADAVPSLETLYGGAIELAAAAEFGNFQFFNVSSMTVASHELAPQRVLTGWKPIDVAYLMTTAIFDEASFDRVRFHHRSIREFLAAKWVERQLQTGVPLHRLKPLFSASPFGHPVLIPSRRSSLSWLAAINVKFREWVTRDFPEVLLYEGDPESWDQLSAQVCLTAYAKKADAGIRLDWYNSAGEYARIGRSVGAEVIGHAITDSIGSRHLLHLYLRIAKFARLSDCATVVFDLYQISTDETERVHALSVLQHIASAEHRIAILNELRAGSLKTNALVSEALSVVDWLLLGVEGLSAVFLVSQPESDYGAGPMARAVRETLLPNSTFETAVLLLGAVMGAMPRPKPGKRFARFPEVDQPERAWLLEVLPDCFERVLNLLHPEAPDTPELLLEAAERIEALRHTQFCTHVDYERLHQLVAQNSALRWKIATAVANSEEIHAAVSRLTWGARCIVSFDLHDLSELTVRANNTDLGEQEQGIWFHVAAAVIFSDLPREQRPAAFRKLGLGEHGGVRCAYVCEQYRRWIEGGRSNRRHQASEAERKTKFADELAVSKRNLQASIGQIRDASHSGTLVNLVNFSHSRGGTRNYSQVDFGFIAAELGQSIADALKTGLQVYWRSIKPPIPTDFTNGQVPYVALAALAGIEVSFSEVGGVSGLSDAEVTNAAQLAVWELNGPPHWLNLLAKTYPQVVQAALCPWICADAQSLTMGNGVRSSIDTAMGCESEVRRGLIAPLAPFALTGGIPRIETFKTIVSALREDGLLSAAELSTLCERNLTASKDAVGKIADMHWLQIWIEANAAAAWAWFSRHLAELTDEKEEEVTRFAAAIGNLKWLPKPVSKDAIAVLIQVRRLLQAYPQHPQSIAPASDSDFFGPPVKRLREAIPGYLASVGGQDAHDALVRLVQEEPAEPERSWLQSKISEHASKEAAMSSSFSVVDLRTINSPFASQPNTEAQLFEQVVARLEEIRAGLQEGPFSERRLFPVNTPEKHLQLWLAAKFLDTPNRRFTIAREEEVDDDKKTDVQLSASTFKVCVEIKPVDSTRSYSANTLTGTLRDQIVGQYLKGANSSRGILVLVQLDDKTWDIPGGMKKEPFDSLVGYLINQAELIKREFPRVQELSVFAMSCNP